MSLQISSIIEEFHEGLQQATLSGGLIEVKDIVNDLFEEINNYHDQDQAMFVDLFDEIDTYQEDDSGIVEPTNDKLAGPFGRIGLNEPIVATIHTLNTLFLKPKMFYSSLITVTKRYRFPAPLAFTITLQKCNRTILPGFVTIIENILRCGIQMSFLPYF